MKDHIFRSVAAAVSCYCFIIVTAVIVLGPGTLFLLFVLLYSKRLQAIHVRPYASCYITLKFTIKGYRLQSTHNVISSQLP